MSTFKEPKRIIDTVYLVVRMEPLLNSVVKTNIKAFTTLESAEIVAEIFQEEFDERGIQGVEFNVELINVYC